MDDLVGDIRSQLLVGERMPRDRRALETEQWLHR
jgi:hypothetical protein